MMGGWAMKTKGCSDYMCPKQAYYNHGPCRFISFFWTVLVWRDYGHQPHKYPRLVNFALPRNIAEEERQQRLLKVAIGHRFWLDWTVGSREVHRRMVDCLWLSMIVPWFGMGDFGGCIVSRFSSPAMPVCSSKRFCQTQFETLCADAFLNPELNQIMIKAALDLALDARREGSSRSELDVLLNSVHC